MQTGQSKVLFWFLRWKRQYEQTNKCSFVTAKGATETEQVSMQTFYCNRSGFFTSKGSGKRSQKAQGSCKINGHCTAGISAKTCLMTGSVGVVLTKTHYGHGEDLGHLKLSQEERIAIGQKLAQGISVDRILDDIRSSLSSSLERHHLVTKKDVKNIERSLGLNGISRHNNDATSVSLWVQEVGADSDSNPVLLYKEQGAPCPDSLDLGLDDFALGIMTPVQRDMLRAFGNNIICMDATHGTNAYDFCLVTVMVVDEFGEGFPVAWLISNREDRVVLTAFLEKVKDMVGSLQAKWIMTDDAEQYYGAWVAAFAHEPSKLLCTWHVDRAWRGALRAHISGNVELQSTVYKTLRCLLDETEVTKFELMLDQVLDDLDSDARTCRFGQYFKKGYAQRKEQWAVCYRKGARINTNMYVEAFHHSLKYIYMKGFANRRVDKCVTLLMQFVRDKTFDRLVKLQKGKKSRRINDIDSRHRQSLKLDSSAVKEVCANKWEVSSSDGKHVYIVEKNVACCVSCPLACKECQVCVHEFSCTCIDGVVRGTLCKHVHLVSRTVYSNRQDGVVGIRNVEQPAAQPPAEEQIIQELASKNKNLTAKTKMHVASKMQELQTLLDEVNDDVQFDAVYKHLEAAVQLVKVCKPDQVQRFQENVSSAPQRVTPQRKKFKSTKKARKTRQPLEKPTSEERDSIVQNLGEVEVVVHQGNDHDYVPSQVPSTASDTMKRHDLEYLELFVNDRIVRSVKRGTKIKECEVEVLPENVPDSVIDIASDQLHNLQRYFDDDAWLIILDVISRKRTEWKCSLCTTTKTSLNMIECELCKRWFHWKCCNIKKNPRQMWCCNFCTKK
ncbi:uncharacterized protein LOC135157532 isoform X1 [Lytechinus pictus]|uniref:uncharacterized protein LOC135157532 isoform X1 n=1 Tax=Lytechinus pictus TaxID=7653 RepID=UPI0030B9B783